MASIRSAALDSFTTLLLLAPVAHATDLLVVDASGGGDFLTIQLAVDAAAPGDLIVVQPGIHAGFTIVGKGVSVIAAAEGVIVEGNVLVEDFPGDQELVLAGLELRQPSAYTPVLRLRTCTGEVRVNGCDFIGRQPVFSDDFEPVVDSTSAARVVLTDCLVLGGAGADASTAGFMGGTCLGVGSSTVILHGTRLLAGRGGDGWDSISCGSGGPGGAAIFGQGQSLVYAAGSELHGGEGGNSLGCGPDGPDGYAWYLGSSSLVYLLDSTTMGPDNIGGAIELSGQARAITASPAEGLQGSRVHLSFDGEAGDEVRLIAALRPETLALIDHLSGFLLVDATFLGGLPTLTLPASGSATIDFELPAVPLGEGAEALHLQAVFRSALGDLVVSNPLALHRAAAVWPDCNGNGVADPEELARGNALDCDGNGVPDECELSSGSHADCDGNGVPDACDILTFRAASPALTPIGAGHPQAWTVAVPPPPAGNVRLLVRARGDFGDQDERIQLRLNGVPIGQVLSAGGSDCPTTPDEAELMLAASTFVQLLQDGDALFELLPSSTVDAFECAPRSSWVELELSYATREPHGDCNADGIPDVCQPAADCDGNGVDDLCDIGSGAALDCNGNAVPDACELASGSAPDCNANGVVDACETAAGSSPDVDGNGVPDECQLLARIHVDADQHGFADGASWSTAHPDLQAALALAAVQSFPAVEIWVAEGTYRPGGPCADRASRFLVPEGVALYGGFAGGEASLEERDVDAHPTVLSGDLCGDDGPHFTGRADNCTRVVELSAGGAVRLDGFTVRGGYADLYVPGQSSMDGGGVVVRSAGSTIARCTFVENHASGYAGAVLAPFATDVRDCRFEGNRAVQSGGAMQIRNGTVSGCTFVGNRAGYAGGGATGRGGTWGNCHFVENVAAQGPGGGLTITLEGGSVIGCSFERNRANEGGALYVDVVPTYPNQSFSLLDCTLVENLAYTECGGVRFGGSQAQGVISNSILWGNVDPTGATEAAQLLISSSIQPIVTYNCVQGLLRYVGNENFDADPLFVDPAGADGLPGTLDDDYRLESGSPCVDSGRNQALPDDVLDLDVDGDFGEPWPFDLDAAPRVVDDPATPDTGPGPAPHVDRGAYERPRGGGPGAGSAR